MTPAAMKTLWIKGLACAGGLVLLAALNSSPARAQKAEQNARTPIISFASRFYPEISRNGIVAAQEKIAARVGADILKMGGNAVDAAVAVGFAMAVTHPQAGNLGGGGFMIISLAGENRHIALDYRETAPAAASRDMFLGANGEVDVERARSSLKSAGVPGTVRGLIHALERYGTLPLKTVIAPAVKLAEEGFPVSYVLAQTFERGRERLARDASSLQFFFKPDGGGYQPGEIWRQPQLARTLRDIAEQGAGGFYEGRVAELIAADMRKGGGLISLNDLKGYRAVEREVIKGTFKGYEIISMPPPSSGGVHLIQMLNILEGLDLKAMGHNSADYLHALIEAMRRAYADRSQYLGDPDFVKVPVGGLTDKRYGEKLRTTIDFTAASRSIDIAPAKPQLLESDQTTHFSVIDRHGNAVSNTYTLNFSFGSGYSVDEAGFLLNNEMDDFSSKGGTPNAFGLIGGDANAIAPGKRPLSSMTPVIILKDGKPYVATGSLGGSVIITTVLQVILNILEFDMNIMEAAAMPRIHHQWLPEDVLVEPGLSVDTLRILESRGFVFGKTGSGLFPRTILGRTNTVMAKDGLFFGAGDPRDPNSIPAGN